MDGDVKTESASDEKSILPKTRSVWGSRNTITRKSVKTVRKTHGPKPSCDIICVAGAAGTGKSSEIFWKFPVNKSTERRFLSVSTNAWKQISEICSW